MNSRKMKSAWSFTISLFASSVFLAAFAGMAMAAAINAAIVDAPNWTQSTTGITTNAAGITADMSTTPMSEYTMIIDRTAGATNVVEIDLQCSINNTAFIQIATIIDLTNEPVLTAIGDVPCLYMRYNVVTVGAGNTLAIDLLATR